jgi:hypothetical protein
MREIVSIMAKRAYDRHLFIILMVWSNYFLISLFQKPLAPPPELNGISYLLTIYVLHWRLYSQVHFTSEKRCESNLTFDFFFSLF